MSRPDAELIPLLAAFAYATRSTCSQRKTGSVITDDKMLRVNGVGYNGNYQGGPHKCDFPDAKGEARCGCIHSEMNAIAKSQYTFGQTIFVTTIPCALCAKQLYNAGIRKVVTVHSKDDEYNHDTEFRKSSIELFKEMGMELVQYDVDKLYELITAICSILQSIKPKEPK